MKKYHIDLTKEERANLSSIIKKRSSKSSVFKRACVLLASDRNGRLNYTDKEISFHYHVSIRMIQELRKRFILGSFEIALHGKKREVFKDKIFTGDIEAKLIALRCTDAPKGHNKWTLRLLSDKMVELSYTESISHETVRQILKKTKLSLGK